MINRIKKIIKDMLNILKKIPKNLIAVAIIIAGVVVAGAVIYTNYSKYPKVLPRPGEEATLSSKEVADKVVNYINQNILRGQATASLVEVVEENGLYKITFDVQGNQIKSYTTPDGKLFFPDVINLTEAEPVAVEQGTTIGDFSVSNDEVCKENDKPIIYFFGSKGCPHCQWEHPVVEEVMAKFEGYVAFHNNMDSDADEEIFSKYSTGGIPTLVFGCKYYRVGSGEKEGKEEEIKNLTAIVCKLTGNQPEEVCSQVQDLVNQIK